MVLMMRQILLMSAVTLCCSWPAFGQDRPEHPRLKDYRATGNVQHCIRANTIRRSNVLDDYTILFEMRGGKTFKNALPYRCFGLGFERAFGYTRTTSLLCNVDIITVISSTGFNASCGLGDFEEIEEIEDQPESPGPDEGALRP